jgi:hypothetical protein
MALKQYPGPVNDDLGLDHESHLSFHVQVQVTEPFMLILLLRVNTVDFDRIALYRKLLD